MVAEHRTFGISGVRRTPTTFAALYLKKLARNSKVIRASVMLLLFLINFQPVWARLLGPDT